MLSYHVHMHSPAQLLLGELLLDGLPGELPLDGLLGEPLLDGEPLGELEAWPQSVLAVWPTNAGGLDGSGQSHPGTSGQAWTFLHRRAISLPHKFLR